LEGIEPWSDLPTSSAPPDHGSAASAASTDQIIHLGSYDHERWSVQREVLAVVEHETSVAEAIAGGLEGRSVVCWHPHYWRLVPEERKRGSRAICVYHHHSVESFDDPRIVGAICLNAAMRDELGRRQPRKPVRMVRAGGSEDAAHGRFRTDPAGKIRLMMCGNALAPFAPAAEGRPATSRKGVELIGHISDIIDIYKYEFIFLGVGWEPHADRLTARGWTVTYPGPLESPGHYEFFGEADVFLSLSRLEGLPLTLLEAMGVGIWPISTPTGIAPELLVHGENGHLLPRYLGHNGEEVAEAAARAITSLDHDQLARARDHVIRSVAHHTWNDFRRDVEDFIHEVFGVR
jgi:glycosyltransferase involved in cell wall biosynthesis